VSWVTPAQFPVVIWKVKRASVPITSKIAGRQLRLNFLEDVHPVQHLGRTLTLEHGNGKARLKGSRSAITACLVPSLDAAHLMASANAARPAGVFSFHMVHDNYGTTAADAPMLAKVLRQTFVEMYEDHDVLAEMHESMSSQLGLTLPKPPARGTLDIRR